MIKIIVLFLFIVILFILSYFFAESIKRHDEILSAHSQRINDLKGIQNQLIADHFKRLDDSHFPLVEELKRAEDDGR